MKVLCCGLKLDNKRLPESPDSLSFERIRRVKVEKSHGLR